MTLIRRTNDLFPSFFDDFVGRDWFNEGSRGTTLPAVNIRESGDDFTVELAAPGMKKNDFHVELDDQVLTISYEKEMKNDEKDAEGHYTKREFNYSSFERTFTLPKSVAQDKIKGEYKDGVLTLTIPKKEESRNKPSRLIEIK